MNTPQLFEDETPRVTSVSNEVALSIGRIHVSYIESLDKLEVVLRAGGSIAQMRAAVDAYDVLSAIARELKNAMDTAAAQSVAA